MEETKTVKTEGKLVSFIGELRLLKAKGLRQKVEVWLLNDITNENNWRYENLPEHKDLFVDTPLLVAYKNGEVGDGHNFKEIVLPDGTVEASFMGATHERIVGFFKNAEDIRMEEKDGKTWIVGIGYIWRWYARELVKKLERQGLSGMSVSIETLIDEMYMDGTTEVFTKYQILGTTILGDDVAPAVKDANICALSQMGTDEIRKLTLRVASENQERKREENQKYPQKKIRKGAQTMKVKELAEYFPGYTVLATNGNTVILLSDKGIPYVSSAVKDGDAYVVGVKDEIAANATFGEGENAVMIPVETITETYAAQCAKLTEALEEEKTRREAVESALNSMQQAEHDRRVKVVKDAITTHFNEVCETTEIEIDDSACDGLLCDESVECFAKMEKDGEFCGDQAARKEVDSICMEAILASSRQKANAKKKIFAWDIPTSEKESGRAKNPIMEILEN